MKQIELELPRCMIIIINVLLLLLLLLLVQEISK